MRKVIGAIFRPASGELQPALDAVRGCMQPLQRFLGTIRIRRLRFPDRLVIHEGKGSLAASRFERDQQFGGEEVFLYPSTSALEPRETRDDHPQRQANLDEDQTYLESSTVCSPAGTSNFPSHWDTLTLPADFPSILRFNSPESNSDVVRRAGLSLFTLKERSDRSA